MYHSSAILLRDGRILVGGSNPPPCNVPILQRGVSDGPFFGGLATRLSPPPITLSVQYFLIIPPKAPLPLPSKFLIFLMACVFYPTQETKKLTGSVHANKIMHLSISRTPYFQRPVLLLFTCQNGRSNWLL